VIRLHRSNRAEPLAQMLARVLATPLSDPFARECIVVQRRGMERWLQMQLADAHGICAGVEFLFPRRFLRERLFAPLLGVERDALEPFEPARLTWEIAALLPQLVGLPGFEDVARYLASDPGPRRLVALARRIAEAFDDYAIYRPELVRGWEQGAEPRDWQAALWRALVARRGSEHSAALVERARAQLGRADLDRALLPERVCVFGLSSLPPLFVSALAALAERRPVHVFSLSPARPGGEPHALLASLGRSGLEFDSELEKSGASAVEEYWSDPLASGSTLLRRLQADLLERRAPGPFEIGEDDESLSIHVCHGPMREAEVARDQILAALDADRSLRLHDIAVLTPDLATHGPLLEAVFASHEGPERIRISVADRSARDADASVQLLEALVELARGRVTSAEVMDLLARDAVRERFGIGASDLEALRGWVERAGIRWGIDAAHRAAEGQPPLAQNTWRRGLERLLVGWAAGEAGRLGDVIAESSAQAAPAELLGRFVEYCETLFELRERLLGERAPVEWGAELARALEQLGAARAGEAAEAQRRLRGALERVAGAARAARFDTPIPLAAFWPELQHALGDAGHAPTHAFLSGAITVCELVPMRSIPFRVVVLVGMGDESFPRSDTRPDFDRIARQRQPGDRSRRDEDRQLFLEALLCARDRLVVTYTGRSPRDGAELPPSVVVDELLDALVAGFERRGEPLDRETFPVPHPLHPFSARYFEGDPRLFSYDARAQRVRSGAGSARTPSRPFFADELPAEPDALAEIRLDELEDFLRHPVRWFCQRRLGLFLGPEDEPLEDREPLELDALERWQLGSELLQGRSRDTDPSALVERIALRGDLPPGALGGWAGSAIAGRVDGLWRAACATGRASASGVLDVDREIDGVRIVGRITGVDADGALVSIQYGKVGRRREVPIWARHVVANWCRGPTRTFIFGEPEQEDDPALLCFEPVEDPAGILSEWVSWIEEGRRRPIPLFCEAARIYAAQRRDGATPGEALAKARKDFLREAMERVPAGESFDAYIALFARGRDPLDAEFERVARALFDPLLQHRGAMR
jgi:exodeoxyribonuclease V gamma subunit